MKGSNKILILGGSSFVGRHLSARLGDTAIPTYFMNPIKNGILFNSLSMRISEIFNSKEKISHAVILLGDSNPETCANDIKKSNKLNVESIKLIIDDLVRLNVKPVFTSSEFVFDGKAGNYIESDEPNPILTYGKQKLEIENYLKKSCSDYIVVRLAKVVGSEKNDDTLFTNWIEDIKQNKEEIICAYDQIFSPIFVNDVVEAIISLINKNSNGVFHLASIKPYSRIELLKMLVSEINKIVPLNVNILPCSIHDFKLKEKRPLNVSMAPDKLIREIGIKISDVKEICKEISKKNFSVELSKQNNKNICLSSINLNDPNKVSVEKGRNSVAYFCKKLPALVNSKLINDLKSILEGLDKKNLRLCLHNSPHAEFHNMIILERKGKYYRPHRHLRKDETFHIIEGKMAVFVFDDKGKVVDSCVLDAVNNFLYRIDKNTFHAIMPISEVVIYHESKPGSFISEGDSIFPDWAPDGKNEDEVERYVNSLKATCKFSNLS